jgi:7,8-dihydropterin-6-yl-methyl-4-(beta-D-ribofuranosyl)aminobenzene 5'-phosphate synthase
MRARVSSIVVLLFLLCPGVKAAGAPSPGANRVTILYDAFGGGRGLTRDWGFSALVEYGGKRILFDTGNNAAIFERNVHSLGVDLRRLDFVVISHRHGDHTSGLNYLLRVNPKVKIFAPKEGFGVFGASLPGTFYRQNSTLPDSMRYFEGTTPDQLSFGTPWPAANFTWIDSLTEVAPGIALTSTISSTPGTLELHELSLVLRTRAGLVLLVGCSHPGIEKILEATRPFGDHLHLIFGGLHLVTAPDTTIAQIVSSLHDHWKLDQIAPGHCTGEPAFAELKRVFARSYLFAGLGTVTALP